MPSDPVTLWQTFKHNICDDLAYALRNKGIPDPSEEQVYDYGLFLIDQILA
jgi:hypothetical protein